MAILDGKVAIVTGASKGMGRHFVEALVDAGARVVALARASAELDTLGAQFGAAVLPIACDVSQSAAVNAAVAETVAKFGRIDFVINNAAVFHPFLVEQGDDAMVRSHVALNVEGPIWLCRATIPHLRKTQGHIVNVSSESVRHPFPMLALYAATKAALEVFSEGLRDELRSDGIRVTILRSGAVDGTTGANHWSEETRVAFHTFITKSGHANFAGIPATPQSMAQALLCALTLPKDVNVDLFEVRSARAGSPVGPE